MTIFSGVSFVSRFRDQLPGAVGVEGVFFVKLLGPARVPAGQAGVETPHGMGRSEPAEQFLVDLLTVDGPVDGLPDPYVQVGVRWVVVGAERGIDAAHDEGNLDGGQFAFDDYHAAIFGLGVKVAVDLGNLHLVGEQVGQTGGRLGGIDLFQLRPEWSLTPVFFDAGVEDVAAHAQLPALELPGAIAGGLVDVALFALGVPLVLAVDEKVALLGRHYKVHGRFRAQQIELHGVVVHDADILKEFIRRLAEQPAEQAGIGGDGFFADNQGCGMGDVMGSEFAPIAVEGDLLPEAKYPLGSVGLGQLPFGGQPGLQRTVEAVGMHQWVSEGTHLGVGRGGGAQPTAHQLLNRRGHRDAEPTTHRLGLLRGGRGVGGPGRGRGDDGSDRRGGLSGLALRLGRGRRSLGCRRRGRLLLLLRRGGGLLGRSGRGRLLGGSAAGNSDHQKQRRGDGQRDGGFQHVSLLLDPVCQRTTN